MQLTTAGNLEAVRGSGLFDTQADIGVQFAEETLSDVAGGNKLTLLASQRAVVNHEVHGNGRLGNLLERNGFRIFRGADGITDMQICDTGYSHDITDGCFLNLNTL